jgi:peptidoglycan/LPS O-acetylase OafA/YrhL
MNADAPKQADAPPKLRFRPDIEGLRAVAIVIALFCHGGLALATGGYVGVDMFFVISGFLITSLLVLEIERTGTLSLARFYAHRAKRLLPLAAVVLVAVVVLSQLLFSPARNDVVGGDVLSAAVYVVNWDFASQSLDYFAPGHRNSPVMHFWSLSIEEQYYIVWPAALLVVTLVFRRFGASVRTGAFAAIAVVGIASFAYSVVYTADAPEAAYFSTFTRVWELGLGGALALAPLPRWSRRMGALLAAAGLAAIAIATVSYSYRTAFPGAAALLPTLGTAALIAAGTAAQPSAITRLLGTGPFRYVGRISYAWYLWHWPMLAFAAAAYGPLTTAQGVVIAFGSGIPAVISHHLIEWPLRRASTLKVRPRRALALGGASMAAAVGAAAVLVLAQPTLPTLSASEVRGATAIEEQPQPQKSVGAIRPDPVHAGDDRSAMQDDGCLVKLEDTESGGCVYGNPDSKTTVVLFGDSLAMQYFPALEALAERHDWRLVGLTKAGCSPAAIPVFNHRLEREYRECEVWRERTLRRVEQEEQPQLIVVSGRVTTPPMRGGEQLEGREAAEVTQEGYVETLERLRDTGAKLAVIKDLPASPRNVPDCVSDNTNRLAACTFEPDVAHGDRSADKLAADRVRGTLVVEPSRVVCPQGICRSVIGDALVFRDYDHLTPTFARTLAPFFERRLPGL